MSNQDTLPNTHSQVDEVLNETEIGSFIAANKNLVIFIIILALASVVGYGVYSMQTEKSNNKNSSIMFEFSKTEFESLKSKKVTAADYVGKLEALSNKLGSFKGLSSLVIASSDELMAQDKVDEALKVLMLGEKFKSPFVQYFINLRLVAAYEDLGKADMAISTLESMTKSEVKLMEGKIFLDLGRLYKDKGEKAKAIENFEKVVKGLNQAEFVKLAKLYLSELK